MGQPKSLERRLHQFDNLRNRYQETVDADLRARYVRKVDQIELNEIRDRLQRHLPHHLFIRLLELRKLNECATQLQSIKM